MNRREAALKKKKQKRIRSWLLIGLALALLTSGAYLLALTLAPQGQALITSHKNWNRPVEKPKIDQNRLYIPKIKLNIDYLAGGPEVLNERAWWRHPERGNPESGGNFILSAHRFELGFTPGQTIRKSPFYHLHKLQEGDKVYVDFEGTRYEYEIEKRFEVRPSQTEIEAPSEDHKLTIYTCMLEGLEAGREVLVARQTQKDVDPSIELE